MLPRLVVQDAYYHGDVARGYLGQTDARPVLFPRSRGRGGGGFGRPILYQIDVSGLSREGRGRLIPDWATPRSAGAVTE